MTNQGKSKKELLAASKDISPVWGTVDIQVPIDDYDHLDCFAGTDSAKDVYPNVLAQLDRHN